MQLPKGNRFLRRGSDVRVHTFVAARGMHCRRHSYRGRGTARLHQGCRGGGGMGYMRGGGGGGGYLGGGYSGGYNTGGGYSGYGGYGYGGNGYGAMGNSAAGYMGGTSASGSCQSSGGSGRRNYSFPQQSTTGSAGAGANNPPPCWPMPTTCSLTANRCSAAKDAKLRPATGDAGPDHGPAKAACRARRPGAAHQFLVAARLDDAMASHASRVCGGCPPVALRIPGTRAALRSFPRPARRFLHDARPSSPSSVPAGLVSMLELYFTEGVRDAPCPAKRPECRRPHTRHLPATGCCTGPTLRPGRRWLGRPILRVRRRPV